MTDQKFLILNMFGLLLMSWVLFIHALYYNTDMNMAFTASVGSVIVACIRAARSEDNR